MNIFALSWFLCVLTGALIGVSEGNEFGFLGKFLGVSIGLGIGLVVHYVGAILAENIARYFSDKTPKNILIIVIYKIFEICGLLSMILLPWVVAFIILFLKALLRKLASI